jgi:alpha-tubulin suppressor-like RCC1 family protein
VRLALIALLVGGCDIVYGLERSETGWSELDPGLSHICGKTRDGAVFCWGGNTAGQVGTGDELPIIDEPTLVDGSWTKVASGLGHVCGIRDDASLWCWGSNSSGMLGNGSTTGTRIPKQVEAAVAGWSDVSAGTFTTCALDDRRRAWCWGIGEGGQLGDGAAMSSLVPVSLGDETWLQIASTSYHTCGLREDRTLWCWGDGTTVLLGDFELDRIVPAPVQIGVATWRQITALADGMCGITTRGTLRCWGDNAWKQMGIGLEEPFAFTPTPVTIEGVDLEDWDTVEGGYLTACGLRGNGQAWCWGDNQRSQIGDGELAIDRPRRVEHPSGGRWASARVGTGNACFVDTASRAWCAGADGQAQLGAGGASPRVPTPVDDAPTATVDAGRRVTCVIRGTELSCAGSGANGVLGDGFGFARETLGPVSGAWIAIASGSDHQCALAMDGRAHCWGSDYLFTLGNGAGRMDSATPVPTAVPSRQYVAIDAGSAHTCAIGIGGAISCWGYGANGQIGDGNLGPAEIPRAIAGGADWSHVSAGGGHTCGIDVSGAVRCWGVNTTGELGDGSTMDRSTPVALRAAGFPPAPLPARFVSIAAGTTHTCAVGADRSMWCWGSNLRGQLATGTGFSTFIEAAQELAETGWASVSAGNAHTCGIKDDATLWCWGANDRGQLGDGSLTDRRTPVRIEGEGWTHVSCGLDHTCGIREATTYCWGNNDDGTTVTGGAWTGTLTEIKEPAR